MPAMSNLLLRKDADGTTDVTLYPVKDFPFPVWRSNDPSLPLAGQMRLELSFETLKSGKIRVNHKLTKPIMAVIPAGTVNSSGIQAAPEVVDEESISTTYFLSPRGNHDTRAELLRFNAHLEIGASATTGDGNNPAVAVANAYKNASSSKMVPYSLVNLLFPGA